MATLESDLSATAGGLLLFGKTACRAGKPRFTHRVGFHQEPSRIGWLTRAKTSV